MKITRQQIQWILRAQSGDCAAMDELLASIQEPIYRYVDVIVRDKHLADDVLQEVLLVVCKKLYWLKEPRAFGAWIYRIASREAFRTLKRHRRHEVSVEDVSQYSAESGHEEEPIEEGMLQRLPVVLARLSPGSRAVLTLHYQCNMTLRQAAEVLDIPVGTAKSRLAYGLAKLREVLLSDRSCTIPEEN